MKAVLIALAATPLLAGCSILQESYDHQAMRQCQDLPNAQERLACERAAADAEYDRRNRDDEE